jgi:hypothetical protein
MFIDRHEERPVPVTSGKEIFKTINQDDEDEDEDDDEDKCNEFIVPHYNEDFMLE